MKLANTIKSYSESFPLASEFSISRGTKTHAHVVRVEISDTGGDRVVRVSNIYPVIDYSTGVADKLCTRHEGIHESGTRSI